MGDFDGRIILVTGSATGLGAAIAVGAARRGAKAVLLNYSKSRQEAEATADAVRTAGAEVAIAQGDVAEDADCRRIAEAAARFGRLDALVNNAGITKHVQNHANLDGLSKEDFLHLYAVNTVGPFQMLRACRPLLEAAEHPSVLMTSSIAAVTGGGSSARVRENVAKSVPLQVAAKPEDIADAALFFISDAARHITGETLLIDGGSHLGVAPTRAR